MRISRIRKNFTRREVVAGLTGAAAALAGPWADGLPISGPGNTGTNNLVFVPNGSYTMSGTIGEGNLVTFGGSSLAAAAGTTGPQLLYYKNFANETAGNLVANGPDFMVSGGTAVANGNGYPYCVSGTGLPYGKGMITSNDSRIGTVSTGNGYGGIVFTAPSQIGEVFVAETVYFPSSCNYTPIATAGTPQVKLSWWYCNKTGGGGFNDTDIYNGVDNETISNAWQWLSNNAPGLASNLTVGTATQWVWNSTPYPKTGVPIRSTKWVQINASPGSGTGNILWTGVWDGSSNTINTYNNGIVLVSSSSSYNGYQICTLPGFVQYTTGTNPNWSVDNNYYVVQSEYYLAGPSSGVTGAAARIEIGDASTYAACTRLSIFTIESPSWWAPSTTGIQARVRGGTFYQSLAGKYVYVTSASNVTTQIGQYVT
jgi:hypothetical protein